MSGDSRPGGDRIKVLIVDDDPATRQMLQLLLRREPDLLVVGEAADGLEAVDQARQVQPDVVVMDMHLPELDGIEAMRRLKTERSGPGIVLLTVYLERAVEALAAGAYDCLCKAGPRAQLLACIRQAAKARTTRYLA
jgi:CheY-like chemotaxis protein